MPPKKPDELIALLERKFDELKIKLIDEIH